MDDFTLETYIRKYIHEQPATEINFTWQGGEPTLLGIDFFKKALSFQRKYSSGKRITNSFQTNGVLLTDEWCHLFKSHDFLVGISIDGPEELHDAYRINKGGQGTFSKVMKGLELLKKHHVEFNTLTVVNNINAAKPVEVYKFLKQVGSKYLQFIPIVELGPTSKNAEMNTIAPWTVLPKQYGLFLIQIFNEWIKKDVGKYFIQIFDTTLANEVGAEPGVCSFSKYCGYCLAIEHNGDVYSCDHFVYPQNRLGNIKKNSFPGLLFSPQQQKFGLDKDQSLPFECLNCDVYKYCHGECPKNRIVVSKSGVKNLNYLCDDYKLFFKYVRPFMNFMGKELKNQRSPANVMAWAKNRRFLIPDI